MSQTSKFRSRKKQTRQDKQWTDFLGQPPKKQKPNLSRIKEYQTKKKQNQQRLAQQKLQRQMQGCTFKPEISSNTTKRPLDQFLKQQKKHEQNRQQKLKSLRQEQQRIKQESEQSTYRPSLCQRSLQLSQISRQGSVFQKLYSLSKLQSSINQDLGLFKPSLSQKSRSIIRTEPISEALYNDALRRINKQQAQKPNPIQVLSSGSQRVLIQKLARQFDQEYEIVDQQGIGYINYSKFNSLLVGMLMIRNDLEDPNYNQQKSLVIKAWNLLAGDDSYVTKQNLIMFLLCVMNLFPGNIENIDQAEIPPGSIGRLIDGQIHITDIEANRIHKTFLSFYTQRHEQTTFSSVKPRTKNFQQELSFTPSIQENSEILAEQYRQRQIQSYGNKTREQIMILQQKAKIEKREKLKMEKEEAEIQNYSFKPKINQAPRKKLENKYLKEGSLIAEKLKIDENSSNRHQALYALSLVKKQVQKTSREVQLQKELEQCTFYPVVNEYYYQGDSPKLRTPLHYPKQVPEGPGFTMDFSLDPLPKEKSVFQPPDEEL